MDALKDAILLRNQENEQLSNCSYTAMRLCECTAECCSCTCYTAAVGAGAYACNPHVKSLYFKNKNASTDEIVLNAALITTYLLGGGWLCSKISQEAANCAEKLKKKNS